MFLNNRHYDPTTGTFISVDPLVTITGQPYIYGAANPVTYSDPTGLEPRPIHCRTNCPKTPRDWSGNTPAGVEAAQDAFVGSGNGLDLLPNTDEPSSSPGTSDYAVWRFENGIGALDCGGALSGECYDALPWWAQLMAPNVSQCTTDFSGGGCLIEVATLVPIGKGARGFRFIDEAAEAMSTLNRTGSGLKDDVYHRAVSWVVDNPASQQFTIRGGDGVKRSLFQLPGRVNNREGVFEWIVQGTGGGRTVTHQRFIPGGSVTGIPNQVVGPP